MKEYYGDEAATQKNLVPDENGVLWYNTEDLLHVNEKGEIFLDGRIRRIVLTYDENGNPTKIIPDKLKNVLLNRADIEKCEVITVPDGVKVNVSIAFVVPKDKNFKSDEFRRELIDYSKENVPEYMIPKDIVFIDDIPVTSSSKPDLKTLEKMYMDWN
ncbi:MAG: AMP-binding enzyme [Eubacterium sp.]